MNNGLVIPGFVRKSTPQDRDLFDDIVEGLLNLSMVERAVVVYNIDRSIR